MKNLVKVVKECNRDAWAVECGFKDFNELINKVPLKHNALIPEMDVWFVNNGGESIQVDWVKSTDGNCDTSTLIDMANNTYGTYDTVVLGILEKGDEGNVLKFIEADVWNNGDEPNETDYVILEDIEEADELLETGMLICEVKLLKQGNFEEGTASEGVMWKEEFVRNFKDGSSDTVIVNKEEYIESGDEVEVYSAWDGTSKGLYGLYKGPKGLDGRLFIRTGYKLM